MSFILLNFVALDGALRVKENDTVFLVLLNNIGGDYKLQASFYDKDTFLLTLFYMVVFYLG